MRWQKKHLKNKIIDTISYYYSIDIFEFYHHFDNYFLPPNEVKVPNFKSHSIFFI